MDVDLRVGLVLERALGAIHVGWLETWCDDPLDLTPPKSSLSIFLCVVEGWYNVASSRSIGVR